MVSRLGIVSRFTVLSRDVLSRRKAPSLWARRVESDADDASLSARSRMSLRALAAARAESSSGRTRLPLVESTTAAGAGNGTAGNGTAGNGTAGNGTAATGPATGRITGFVTG
jgi:hypothetical protein